MTLEELKSEKIEMIDFRTKQLISDGFNFDGHIFSLSVEAQINWSNILNVSDQLFPLNVIDKNDDLYILELNNKTNFYLSALNGKNTHLQSGGYLKTLVKNAQTEEEVNLIIDNR